MKEVWLNIQYAADRSALVWSLVNSGYTTKVVTEHDKDILKETKYWVVFWIPENNIKPTQ